jgi:hypothetical protein
MHVKERLIAFVEYLGMSNSEFCRSIGVSTAFISSMRKSMQPDKIESIALKYPKLSTEWLLTGQGKMIKEDENEDAFYARQNINVKKAPLIKGQYAYAGYLAGFSDPEYLNDQPIYFSKHDHNGGNYIAFEVRGDSMDDNSRKSICQGDIVLGCELKKEYWIDKLFIPKVFIIVHRENGIVIKEVIAQDLQVGIITCHSWNQSPEYKDFNIHMNDIIQMFYIKEINRDFKL